MFFNSLEENIENIEWEKLIKLRPNTLLECFCIYSWYRFTQVIVRDIPKQNSEEDKLLIRNQINKGGKNNKLIIKS